MKKEQINEEYRKLKALQAVSNLEGVQFLVKQTKDICKNSIDLLANTYAEKSESELKAICATLKANLNIYQIITGVEKEIEALDEILKEDM
jgi:predicted MPP superfamily phosphohydrolase